MNEDIKKFITSTMGKQGLDVLERMCKNDEFLTNFLEIRAILAWINNIASIKEEFKGKVPGFPLSLISLKKNIDNTFAGQISLNDLNYSFERSNLMELSAAMGIGMGLSFDLKKNEDTESLQEIGRCLDLLTKVNIIQTAKIVKLEKNQTRIKIKIPNTEIRTLKLKKNEINNKCNICNESFIKNDIFVGCLCLVDLADNVELKVDGEQYLFTISGLNKKETNDLVSVINNTNLL